MTTLLEDFIAESNRIEGIRRPPTEAEIAVHEWLLGLDRIEIDHLCEFVRVVARREIRDRPGMDVHVGAHHPPPGGPIIREQLMMLLADAHEGWSPYAVHRAYETLHPFMDGNGRSGRALWLWMMLREGSDPHALMRGFLHTWYYQSLQEPRDA